MTRARIRETGETVRITLKGHAEYNPGNDIVCASISTLTYTLINCLLDMKEHRQLDTYICHDAPGDISVVASAYKMYSDKLADLIWSFRIGMSMISEHYPEHLTIEEGGYDE